MDDPDEVERYGLVFESNGGDAGLCFTLQCPRCMETIRVAEWCWWNTTCSCRIEWKLDLRALGYHQEETS